MPKLQTSHKVLILGILSLCASGILYWFINAALTKKAIQYTEAREAKAYEDYVKENESKALDVLSKTAGVRSSLYKYFVSINDPLELLAMVDGQLPRMSGVSVKVIDGGITKETVDEGKDTKENTKSTAESYVRIAINVKGDWSNMYHYLLLLEHMPYATTIDKVVLTKSQTGGDYEWEGDVFLAAATNE